METRQSPQRQTCQTIPSGWRPTLGAWIDDGSVRFRVWVPEAQSIDVVFEPTKEFAPLTKFTDGTFGGKISNIGAGARYRYRIDGKESYPDPASRYQPDGVHGPSEVIDASSFTWTDSAWKGIAQEKLVFYELHVGTFSPQGTFQGVLEYLPYLVQLGVTAIELMPLADFPGERNWGYDGVNLFAPARCYGRPDDLRRVVNEAHRLGIAVFLDVVYNHLGPEGNYLPLYSPYYFSETRENPWGKSLNFDGPKSSMVRQFFIENALHWIHQYHFDGLRLDATHAIQDEDPRHFVAQLATRVRESAPERMVYVIAEDHRNWAHIIRPEGEGGWGLDGVWADDFHHKVRVTLAGDSEGYFSDFKPSMPELAGILNQGWQFTGQYSEYLKKHRGTETAGVPAQRFVFCLQNHDQIGNRAQGERLHHQVDLSAYRAASVLLLTAPATPLLFMGQEWACSSPFLYFTDHPAELGRLVTEGRRNEFRHFSAFSDPATRQRIPDPQAEKTFELSRLKWDEINQEPYASLHRLYQRLLAMRIAEPAIQNDQSTAFAVGEKSLLIRRDAKVGAGLIIVVHMEGSAEVDLTNRDGLQGLDIARCQLVLSTEDLPFATDPHPPSIEYAALGPKIDFVRPGALIFSVWPTRESVS